MVLVGTIVVDVVVGRTVVDVDVGATVVDVDVNGKVVNIVVEVRDAGPHFLKIVSFLLLITKHKHVHEQVFGCGVKEHSVLRHGDKISFPCIT